VRPARSRALPAGPVETHLLSKQEGGERREKPSGMG
jgi:hypothetical protein